MHKIDAPNATASGEFTDGDPSTGVIATELVAKWHNTVQRELVAIVEAAGLVLNDADDGQALQAITDMISAEAQARAAGDIPSGTQMLFVQSAAPVGWTKKIAHNDKALRVVSGTAGSGGTNAFTSAFASRVVDGAAASGAVSNATLNSAQGAVHGHRVADGSGGGIYRLDNAVCGALTGRDYYRDYINLAPATGLPYIENSSGGQAHGHTFTGYIHSHGLNMSVQYVDVIIATKD